MNALTETATKYSSLRIGLADAAARAADLADHARAASTRKVYRSDWLHYVAWCGGPMDLSPSRPSPFVYLFFMPTPDRLHPREQSSGPPSIGQLDEVHGRIDCLEVDQRWLHRHDHQRHWKSGRFCQPLMDKSRGCLHAELLQTCHPLSWPSRAAPNGP